MRGLRFWKWMLVLWAILIGLGNLTPRVYAHPLPPIPGEFVIQRSGTGAASDLSRLGGTKVAELQALQVELWRFPPQNQDAVLQALEADPTVRWIEPNRYIQVPQEIPNIPPAPAYTPSDPYYASYAARYLAPLGVEQAWEITRGSKDIIVAVVDTGVDCDHPDLQGACWVNRDEIPGNGIDDDGNGYVDDVHGWNFALDTPDIQDVHYHGTHVAGIIGARANREGVIGIAPQTTLMPIGVFQPQGIGTYFDLIRAILYAVDNGAHVINLSLGATSYGLGEAAAVRYAEEHRVTVIAAAGNLGLNRYFFPAAHPSVLAVAALDVRGKVASFSNYGDYIDVAAPGVSVISTIPGGRYGMLSGTSMAAPHVSGLAALLLSRDPSLSPLEIRSIITRTADDQVGPTTVDTPGWDPHYGYGRINVSRAVTTTHPTSAPPQRPSLAPALPWTPTCVDLLQNGGFEQGFQGWEAHNVHLVSSPVYEGETAARFSDSEAGFLRQAIQVPEKIKRLFDYTARQQENRASPRLLRLTFFAALRIETRDYGYGSRPDFPFDDWLTISLERGEEQVTLLRAGNSSDNVNYGLAWDEVFGLLPRELIPHVLDPGWALVVRTGQDGDGSNTTFTLDAFRVCAVMGRPRSYHPFLLAP